MAFNACVRRAVRSSLGSSMAFAASKSKPKLPSSAPRQPCSPLSGTNSHLSRLPRALGSVESLMPLHSVTASALLTSMLSVNTKHWGWLAEGFATTL